MTEMNDLGFDMGDKTLTYAGNVIPREQKHLKRRKKRFYNTYHCDMLEKYALQRDKRIKV